MASSLPAMRTSMRQIASACTRQWRYLSTKTHPRTIPRVLISQPARRTLSSTPQHLTSPSASSSITSTPEGTIASGSSGTPIPPSDLSEAELNIFTKLAAALEPQTLQVQDISGGCGSMFGIDVCSERFRGLSVLKQQRLVNEILKEEIKAWHGVQLRTRCP